MQTIARVLRPILTATEYALAVLLVAVSTQIIFGNSLQTWVITVISICLTVFTLIIWYSDGVERGENVPKVYNTTLRYHAYARKILSLQNFDTIRDFCDKKNKEYELDLLSAKLSEYELTLQNLSDYKEARKKARETAIIKPKCKLGKLCIGSKLEYTDETYILLCKRYTIDQLKLLNKFCDRKIKFEHLQVKDIIRATDSTVKLVPKNTEKKLLPTKIISKIVWGAILGIFTAGVVFTRRGEWTINETIQVVSWAFSISLNIFLSIRFGYKTVVVNRYDYYKAKNELCAEYFSFVNTTIDAVEAEYNLAEQFMQDEVKKSS